MHWPGGVAVRLVFFRTCSFPAFLLTPLLSLFVLACGGTSVTEVSGPSAVPGGSANRCETTLSGAPASINAEGGQFEARVVAARECAWTASIDASWAQVAPVTGQGEGTVVVTVAANPQASARSTSLALNGSRTTLAQAAAPCRYGLGSSGTHQPSSGGTASLSVSTLSGCAWTATSPVS